MQFCPNSSVFPLRNATQPFQSSTSHSTSSYVMFTICTTKSAIIIIRMIEMPHHHIISSSYHLDTRPFHARELTLPMQFCPNSSVFLLRNAPQPFQSSTSYSISYNTCHMYHHKLFDYYMSNERCSIPRPTRRYPSLPSPMSSWKY